MMLDRRSFLTGTLASGATSFRLRPGAARARFSPEAFGAAGDGVRDDYDAFAAMVRAANRAGGGTVVLGPGRTYLLDRFIHPAGPVQDLTFSQCNGLEIDGNGANIRVKGDFHRDRAPVRSLSGFVFRDCRDLGLRNLELAGGVERTTRSPGLTEPPSYGLAFQSCTGVTIDDVTVRHFAADGLYIRESNRRAANGKRRASHGFAVRNSRFLFNARQGLSVIQLRDGVFENCDFSHTGYIDRNGKTGPYGAHSPGAGVDIEPNRTPRTTVAMDVLTGELSFEHCRMVGNHGAGFVACKFALGQSFLERVRLHSCLLQCEDGPGGGRDGFIFDVPQGEVSDCTLRLAERTAYIGWYAGSEASPRFTGNTITGRPRGPKSPLLHVRETLGAPAIVGNRIIAEADARALPDTASLLTSANPRAVLRDNPLLIGS